MIPRNPTDGATRPRVVRKEMSTLTEEQLRRLFEVTEGDRFGALWVVLGPTGLRLGEALGLRWADADLLQGRLTVRRALQRLKEVGFVFAEPKSARSRRTVYLASGTVEVLQRHLGHQRRARLAAGPAWADGDLVFCNVIGRPQEADKVSRAFWKALELAQLPRIRIHDLRHTAATLLLLRAVHPKIVQELLGHSSVALTLDTYSHATPALHAEAVVHMQELLAPPGARGS